MVTSTLDQIKSIAVPILMKAGVTRSAIFGSFARGDANKQSDVDFLIDVPRGTTLFDLVDLENALECSLNKKVDLVTYGSIHPLLRDIILDNQVQIL